MREAGDDTKQNEYSTFDDVMMYKQQEEEAGQD